MQSLKGIPQVTKRNISYSLIVMGILVCMISGILWTQHNQPQTVIAPPPLVRTLVIGAADNAQKYTYSGEVHGRYESKLSFQVSGKIIKRNVELGSIVTAGDILMQIDAKDIQQAVNSNLAQVASAQSQFKLAESNLGRYQHLLDSGAISRAQYDQYVNAYDVAAASLNQASAQYAQGENQLDYSLLRADQSGVISSISAEVGQVVSSGQSVLALVQDGEREVEISVPENRIEELRKAKQIKITFWALSNTTADGTVREISPMADSVTRTYKVRIGLINPPQEVRLGMTAAVTLSENAIASTIDIPLTAIYQTNDSPSVWVVNNNVLALRPIKTGKFGKETIQVLSGLAQGDRIVISGVHKLTEGQKVSTEGDSL